ncbi:MAG: hypothetical protein KZQ87_18175 [Candidatus Thiodiazotropha sp. (ex Cardiolucina cf. quadrata)]|nr:hypothetical protein [Candidatus Thiodiazotropha sp. (ex Cardiolucina cf. quadrata)]
MDENGKAIYSQQSCGDSSEVVTVKPIQPSETYRESMTVHYETLEGIATRTEIKKLEHQISRLNGRLLTLESKKSPN